LAKLEQAVEYYAKALALKPDSSKILTDLAEAYKRQHKFNEAVEAGGKALDMDPQNTRILLILGDVCIERRLYDDAIRFYRKALDINPDSVEANISLGHMLHEQGKSAQAKSCFRAAMTLDPGNLRAKLGNCVVQIPRIHRSTGEIVQSRENYRKALEELCQSVDLSDPAALERARNLVGYTQPFYLSYQGENDRELQAMYGDLMVRIQAACFPEWAKKPPMPPVKRGEPIRVGILSGYFRMHSVWKIPIKGWIENLNREEFQLYGYYTGWANDEQTETAKKSFYKFTENLPRQDDWLKHISEDRLHILIIPEIGQDPITLRLAASRLAPVQCTSLGHPETSGFPTIDYFLSSELMEPENGQEHYCEKLVRLPNLSIYYEPPDIRAASVDRSYFGLRDDIPLFLCTQSLFKYLPQYDEVFPRIALQAGACQFAFLGDDNADAFDELFLRRLETAFSRFNLRMNDYAAILPYLDSAHYRALNQLADVFLNSMGWSGFNSTMEALACDLPVVTMPGELARGRHTHAIMKMIDLCETEGSSIDEYVAIAARLIKEPAWRKEISEKIARNRGRAYRDMECIRSLEEFIRQAVAQATGEGF